MFRIVICLFFIFIIASTLSWSTRDSIYFYLYTFLGVVWGFSILGSIKERFFAPLISIDFSFPVILLGLYFIALRINFILENGGMESPDGMGSPMAFLIGFLFELVFLAFAGTFVITTSYRRLNKVRFKVAKRA